jgi:hypothetical protein
MVEAGSATAGDDSAKARPLDNRALIKTALPAYDSIGDATPDPAEVNRG